MNLRSSSVSQKSNKSAALKKNLSRHPSIMQRSSSELMQRVLGNHAVSQNVSFESLKNFSQAPATDTATPMNHAENNRSSSSLNTIQPKLKIGEPDDHYEKEADHVAARIMRMSAPASEPPPDDIRASGSQVQRKCDACLQEDKKRLQMKTESNRSTSSQRSSPSLAGLRNGRPLDSASRNFFEPRFGYNFNHVRVHTDAHAQTLNHQLQARAFTYGHDIAFAQGAYQPNSYHGRQLMAHELTHVVQQGRAQRHVATDAAPSIQRKMNEPMIQRACVANLIPLLRCCDYSNSLPPTRIGTIAHNQLEMGAALMNPGVLGEVGIPPVLGFGGWKSMDLFRASPRTMPSQVGNPTAGMRPLVNPLGIPYGTAPPAIAPGTAEVGEIKPLSTGGIVDGPVDLAANLLQYRAWGALNGGFSATAGMPMQSALPLIYGGPFLSAAFGNSQHIFMGQALPGLYNYFCIDPKRMRREIRAKIRRLQQRIQELIQEARQLLDSISDFIAEWWWVMLIILIVLIIIIVLVIIFTAPVSVPAGAGAAAVGGTAVVAGGTTAAAGGTTVAAGGTALTATGVTLTVVEGGAAGTAAVGGAAIAGETLAAAAAIIFAILSGESLLHPDGEPLGNQAATAEGELSSVIPGGRVPPQAESGGGPTLAALTQLDSQLASLGGVMRTNPGGSFSAGPNLPGPGAALSMIEGMTPTVAGDPRFGDTASSLAGISSRSREAMRHRES